MTTKLTLFTATLVQDSSLSISGIDRETSAALSFTVVDGLPTLVGRGMKGAAVAMAKRFFEPLPRSISDDVRQGTLRRSAWEFADATAPGVPVTRASVGIRHKTAARASGVLFDREVIPAGTKWQVSFRVDWSWVTSEEEGRETEGILGYVLAQQWAKERCWLGGGITRGLGWCHIENLKAYRLDETTYDVWVKSGRVALPAPLVEVPAVSPTRSWCFRTLDVDVCFGEYRPEGSGTGEAPWGLDMFSVGPHNTERAVQPTSDGIWAKPVWALDTPTPDTISTDRSLLMEAGRPLLPGSSVLGPLRQAYSRDERKAGREVIDPHLVHGDVGDDDPAGKAFGSARRSGHVLFRDARAEKGWTAAKLHMHAEDEFSAGSYGSAKRDAVRLLDGVFPVRIVVEGPSSKEVDPLVAIVDRQVALGALGHLPIGGFKTRGAGSGRWQAKPWVVEDVRAERSWALPRDADSRSRAALPKPSFLDSQEPAQAWVRTKVGAVECSVLSLGEATKLAKAALGERELIAWWCDPTINLALSSPPTTFDRAWPSVEDALQVDEVAFYSERAVWRAARTSSGSRYVLIEELSTGENGAKQSRVVFTPALLHGFQRFSSANTGQGSVLLREWHIGNEVLGFTISKEQR